MSAKLELSARLIDLLDLGPSASQSSDGDASAASRILVVSFLQVCSFDWCKECLCSFVVDDFNHTNYPKTSPLFFITIV